MSEQFSLSLNEEEKAYLKDLVHLSILKRVQERLPPAPAQPAVGKVSGRFRDVEARRPAAGLHRASAGNQAAVSDGVGHGPVRGLQ